MCQKGFSSKIDGHMNRLFCACGRYTCVETLGGLFLKHSARMLFVVDDENGLFSSDRYIVKFQYISKCFCPATMQHLGYIICD